MTPFSIALIVSVVLVIGSVMAFNWADSHYSAKGSDLVGITSIIAGIAAGIFLVFGGLFAFVAVFERNACQEKAAAMQVESSWGYWKGCIVYPTAGGPGVPLDNYRGSEQVERGD
jgi:heme/copper-type cytochrome/quinol oxidase subunit 2